jgi:hypothetical protein
MGWSSMDLRIGGAAKALSIVIHETAVKNVQRTARFISELPGDKVS